MNPGDVWDSLQGSTLHQGSTIDSMRQARCRKLKLGTAPNNHYVSHKRRTIDLIPAAMREAIRAVVSGKSPWPLFCCGEPGVGKSCAGLVLLDYAGGSYLTAQGLAEKLIDAANGRLTYRDSGRLVHPTNLWEEWGSSPLVVLDEIGQRSTVSDFAYDSVKQLLDIREGKPLLVLSNLGLDEIAKVYDDRVASRLVAGTVIRLVGEDLRTKRPPLQP